MSHNPLPALYLPPSLFSGMPQTERARDYSQLDAGHARPAFDPEEFLANAGQGRKLLLLKAKQTFFIQGDVADNIIFLQRGRVKLTVVSEAGKEATVTLLAPGQFLGEESLANADGRRLATATALTNCSALKIDREQMIRTIHEEHAFSDYFLKFLLLRVMRTQADLVDQLFNSSEKRLARVLLLMAEFGNDGGTTRLIPKVTQETLAEMVGTTRSRVSFFMNRFRKMGLVEYNGRIRVNKALLNVVVNDKFFNPNVASPEMTTTPLAMGRDGRRVATHS